MSSYDYNGIIDYDDISYGNVTINMSGIAGGGGSMADTIDLSGLTMNTVNIGAVGAGGSAGGSVFTSASPYVYTTNGSYNTLGSDNGLTVQGDTNIKGNLVVNGANISETLETIQKRLAILVPDPAKLEKYEALQKAYEQYKLLEALCIEPTHVDPPEK